MFRMFCVIAIKTALSECTGFMLYLQIQWKLDIICGMLSLSGVSMSGEGNYGPGGFRQRPNPRWLWNIVSIQNTRDCVCVQSRSWCQRPWLEDEVSSSSHLTLYLPSPFLTLPIQASLELMSLSSCLSLPSSRLPGTCSHHTWMHAYISNEVSDLATMAGLQANSTKSISKMSQLIVSLLFLVPGSPPLGTPYLLSK